MPLCQTASRPYRLSYIEKRQFWKIGHFDFFSSKKIFFCFILMKISPNLYGRLDGSKFWHFPWFPAIFLLCVIKRYTVYTNFVFIDLNYGLQSGQLRNTLLYICGILVWAWTYLAISCRPSIRLGIVFKNAPSPSSKLKMGVSPLLNGNSPIPLKVA